MSKITETTRPPAKDSKKKESKPVAERLTSKSGKKETAKPKKKSLNGL